MRPTVKIARSCGCPDDHRTTHVGLRATADSPSLQVRCLRRVLKKRETQGGCRRSAYFSPRRMIADTAAANAVNSAAVRTSMFGGFHGRQASPSPVHSGAFVRLGRRGTSARSCGRRRGVARRYVADGRGRRRRFGSGLARPLTNTKCPAALIAPRRSSPVRLRHAGQRFRFPSLFL